MKHNPLQWFKRQQPEKSQPKPVIREAIPVLASAFIVLALEKQGAGKEGIQREFEVFRQKLALFDKWLSRHEAAKRMEIVSEFLNCLASSKKKEPAAPDEVIGLLAAFAPGQLGSDALNMLHKLQSTKSIPREDFLKCLDLAIVQGPFERAMTATYLRCAAADNAKDAEDLVGLAILLNGIEEDEGKPTEFDIGIFKSLITRAAEIDKAGVKGIVEKAGMPNRLMVIADGIIKEQATGTDQIATEEDWKDLINSKPIT